MTREEGIERILCMMCELAENQDNKELNHQFADDYLCALLPHLAENEGERKKLERIVEIFNSLDK